VNPVTNRAYVLNCDDDAVSVIDGLTRNTKLVWTDTAAYDISVNPLKNRVFIPHVRSKVTMINGETNDTVVTNCGGLPGHAAVNPVANRVYVAIRPWFEGKVRILDATTNQSLHDLRYYLNAHYVGVNPVTGLTYLPDVDNPGRVLVMHGMTLDTAWVATLPCPDRIAVNPVTNHVYLISQACAPPWFELVGLNGATNDTSLITPGSFAHGLGLNLTANRIYVPEADSARVAVIDGLTHAMTKAPAGTEPVEVAVNEVTNRVYVTNWRSGDVTVIDGMTNRSINVPIGHRPEALALDPLTNRVYVPLESSDVLVVLDGVSNATTRIPTAPRPWRLGVNPVTGRVYVGNHLDGRINVIQGNPARETGVQVHFVPELTCSVYAAQPAFRGKAVNRWNPNHTGIQGVLTQRGALQRAWSWATLESGSGSDSATWVWSWVEDSLSWGENYLCCVPLEAQAATTNNLGLGTPFAGNVLIRPIYRVLPYSALEHSRSQRKTQLNASRLVIASTIVRGPTEVRYWLTQAGAMSLALYDVSGQRVRTLLRGQVPTSGLVVLNPTGLAPGIYFLRLSTPTLEITKKVVLK
ncbi:MAG: T9SS type A sorting domain-containing protein, partial [candidate division WOR-3 bacterium]